MSKEWSPDDVFDVLADETARTILLSASRSPRSVQELADACGRSKPTVYRRLNRLAEYDLLTEQIQIDAAGNHFSTYETNLRHICFEVNDEEFEVHIRFRRDLADKFDSLWQALERPERTTED